LKALDKILKTRITDRSFKVIFFSTAMIVLGSVLFLLLQAQTMKDSVETLASQKSITVISEDGTQFKKKIYETNTDIATIFAITYTKKALGFGYLNYKDVFNFLQVYSDTSVVSKYKKKILTNTALKQLNILNATYKTKILQYKINNVNNSNKNFEFLTLVEQTLLSETQTTRKKLVTRIKIDFTEPTTINSSGIFVTNFEIEDYDVDKHESIFE